MVEIEQTINLLSIIISKTLRTLESERYHPDPDVDKSDQLIKDSKDRVIVLRKIREDFENEMAK